jgi:hypothetical protein
MTKEEILHKAYCLKKIGYLFNSGTIFYKTIFKKHKQFDLDYTLWELKPMITKISENDYHLMRAANKFWNLVDL